MSVSTRLSFRSGNAPNSFESKSQKKNDANTLPNMSHLDCGVCMSIMHNSTSILPCMHSFCGGCITKWFMENNNCPFCRAPGSDLVWNRQIRNEVENVLSKHVEKQRSPQELAQLDDSELGYWTKWLVQFDPTFLSVMQLSLAGYYHPDKVRESRDYHKHRYNDVMQRMGKLRLEQHLRKGGDRTKFVTIEKYVERAKKNRSSVEARQSIVDSLVGGISMMLSLTPNLALMPENSLHLRLFSILAESVLRGEDRPDVDLMLINMENPFDNPSGVHPGAMLFGQVPDFANNAPVIQLIGDHPAVRGNTPAVTANSTRGRRPVPRVSPIAVPPARTRGARGRTGNLRVRGVVAGQSARGAANRNTPPLVPVPAHADTPSMNNVAIPETPARGPVRSNQRTPAVRTRGSATRSPPVRRTQQDEGFRRSSRIAALNSSRVD